MSIEDLHDLTPIPELEPDALGAPPAPMAPPALPPAPQMGQPVQDNRSQKLLTLAALATMIAGGKATSGFGSGILQGQQRMENERQQREAQQINERRYQEQQAQSQQLRFQQEQQRYQQTLQQRQQSLMGAMGDIRRQVSTVKDKATYDQQVEGYANLLRSAGYRIDANWIRQAAPFSMPKASEQAAKMIDDFQKEPINKGILARPDLYVKQKWRIDANGDGVPEEYDTPSFYALAGRGFAQDPETGAPIEVPAEVSKPGNPFQEIMAADLETFRVENGRLPDSRERKKIIARAVEESDRSKPDPTLNAIRELQLSNLRNAPALPPNVQRRVDAKSKAFDSQPAVKRTQTMAEAVLFADNLDPNTKNPADDQALIYAFAKAMDPDSVVREGEYATVQKYGQSWADAFGFNAARIFSNTAFLTPQARANMKQAIRSRYQAARTQYDNLASAYAKQIDGITGQPGTGQDYLVDYAGAFPDAALVQGNQQGSARDKYKAREGR
jgi:hypothetical protein